MTGIVLQGTKSLSVMKFIFLFVKRIKYKTFYNNKKTPVTSEYYDIHLGIGTMPFIAIGFEEQTIKSGTIPKPQQYQPSNPAAYAFGN